MCAIFAAWTEVRETTKWEGNWKKQPVYGFELACNRSCKHDTRNACINCFEKSFGSAPEKMIENTSKQNDSDTPFQTAENNLNEIPIQDPIEVNSNVTKNIDRSHKLLWNLPDKCYSEKFDVCKNLSCCSYNGLFLI